MTLLSEIAGRSLRLPAPRTRDVVVEHGLRATMDDGVVLLADRYVARGGERDPVVLVRSPYGRSRSWVGLFYGRLLAERGFQVVVQSVRGTFGSGGAFAPFDERADGLATLRWLREQPWCGERIGMIGSSYMGLVQWAVAAESGDALGALAPSITASQFHSQAYGGGSISLETALSWTMIIAAQERRLGSLRLLFGLRRRLPRTLDELPLGTLDHAIAGRELPWFREWFEQTAPDEPYWSARDYSADVARVRAPVHLVGGWHDIFLPWLLADHAALVAAGVETQLVVGPWAHTSTGMLATSLREGLGWLRAHLLGDRRMLSGVPVRVWVSGEEGWRDLDRWPPAGTRPWTLHLHPGGRLAEAPPPAGAAPDRYRYDPAQPTPALGGPVLLARQPVVDNRPLEARDDVLVYTSDPLERDVVAMGPVGATIHLRSTREHTDAFVRVCDVLPSGPSLNVCDALVRLQPGAPAPDADGVRRVELALWPTAHRFRRGHRIRVQVSSGAHPRYARNPGTGEPPATARTLVAADQEVFHDADRPSAVTLTLAPR
ncbi:MAG: CocE/NonD family hydrolase [Solirubrobacteraceae bacterium]|nr:CocE/NonD family hydrolase [Solirubrobacteraceae bacterium]